ncbi:MAG: cyclase family protein [Gammaproteobacteria bacterium]|nr:cyclase family protein [Gammaproteobacteria bacterium]
MPITRILSVAAILLVCTHAASAQMLSGDDTLPSEWGADDERGAANRITPQKVLEATQLIKEGRIYELGRVYEAGMPLFPGRHYSLTIPGSPTGGPMGRNNVVYHDEMISGQIGQIGTQFDGLGHVGSRIDGEDVFFNGFKRSEFGTAGGLGKLGVENVGVFVTRGVLIDMAGYKGVDRLPVGTVITAQDLQDAMKKQKVELSEGDVVLIHTGHGTLWMVDNEKYNRGAPGIGMEAALWLAEKKVAMTGADTWPVEVIPSEDPELAFPVHQELIARRGIYNIENLDLSELAADKVYEFAFMFAPVKFKGATGSPGNPIAIR